MSGLTLKKGGILVSNDWEYDDVKEEGSYVDTDVSEVFLRRLWDTVKVDEDVTLRDLTKLLQNVPNELLSVVFGDWIDEFVDAISGSSEQLPEHVKAIELYWHMVKSDNDNKYDTSFPQCHILGKPTTKKEYYGEYGCSDPKDFDDIIEKPAYGVMGHSAAEYADAPIALVYETDFYASDIPGKGNIELTTDLGYTLGQVVKGTFWELSFNGSIKSSAEFAESIKSMVADMEESLK